MIWRAISSVFFEWQRARTHEVPECDALNELHHEKLPAAVLRHFIQRGNVRMIEGGERFRFALESRDAIGIVEMPPARLYGDLAAQLRVSRAVDLAHPTGAHGATTS